MKVTRHERLVDVLAYTTDDCNEVMKFLGEKFSASSTNGGIGMHAPRALMALSEAVGVILRSAPEDARQKLISDVMSVMAQAMVEEKTKIETAEEHITDIDEEPVLN